MGTKKECRDAGRSLKTGKSKTLKSISGRKLASKTCKKKK